MSARKAEVDMSSRDHREGSLPCQVGFPCSSDRCESIRFDPSPLFESEDTTTDGIFVICLQAVVEGRDLTVWACQPKPLRRRGSKRNRLCFV